MKLKLDIDPDIVAMMAAEVVAGERAMSAAIREAGTGLKAAWRLQITGAALGPRLARTIRSEQFPKATPSLDAAAVVWSQAPVIVGADDTGPLIRSKTGLSSETTGSCAIREPLSGTSHMPESGGGRIGKTVVSWTGQKLDRPCLSHDLNGYMGKARPCPA